MDKWKVQILFKWKLTVLLPEVLSPVFVIIFNSPVCVCVCVYMYICVYIYICVCVCVCVCISGTSVNTRPLLLGPTCCPSVKLDISVVFLWLYSLFPKMLLNLSPLTCPTPKSIYWHWALGWEIPFRKAWKHTPVFLPGETPWTEEPGRLQSLASQSWTRLSD